MAAETLSDSRELEEFPLSPIESQSNNSLDFDQTPTLRHADIEDTVEVPFWKIRSPYVMNDSSTKHGMAVIINIVEITGYKPRQGAQQDEENLKELFTLLHYDVMLKRDLNRCNFDALYEEMKQKDFGESDSFVCCFLSHGGNVDNKEFILLSDGSTLSVNQLKQMAIENNSLNGKPKLFFIQACRGSELPLAPIPASDDIKYRLPRQKHFLPYYSDVFVGYATSSNTKAIREQVDYPKQKVQAGSWYITELCHVWKILYKSHDLLSMMTIVHNILANDVRYMVKVEIKGSDDHEYYRQAGQLESTLIRPFYFKPIPPGAAAVQNTDTQSSCCCCCKLS